MNIGLIDVDGHHYPNLALMKLSAWHKANGDSVEWWWGFGKYDRVYMSKVFDDTYSPDIPDPVNALEVIRGGTGYGFDNYLPDEIEHIYPDYSIYPELTKDTAFGFLSRGCPRACPFCIVSSKEGRKSIKVSDLSEWWSGQKNIVLMDPNTLACPDHMDLLRQLADSKSWVDINAEENTLAQPNEPLTLEELREMDGEPVWVRCLKPSQYADPPVRWRILEKSITGHFGVWNGDGALIERTYGVDWLAYRRSPEQGDNHG